ncbi:16S rRNA (uracil(1498)-N(3))-methyltransferase [Acinetobacter sp. B5B]|uniref:16S rRNA (uracil(1498)-N(3))-methyltransferase n=1 Tax=Acinetobacter baretiae TaxID=2605383 RepID=UPI0018C23211|nr:16S rRNA (uracil(1498)-N(3))-methyltransferase [Acinetobacter baretiae]MBF7683068.1 16S rRNA (uracil(1498)-N(3))-methyltransferase [Acinetobacter baretiae]MBF7684280.1 16S rRNA (uracil(1498)-N(3))-methyltransferase [Acinetobacter baretiae]
MSSRFYIDTALACNTHVELTETVFHHWIKVLRAKINDQAILFNGLGGEYEATVIEINKKNAIVEITAYNPDNRTPSFKATLGQVMSKGDRMDYAIQKAVELGVHDIQLLTSERCEMRLKYERDQKKIEHWQNIAIAACEQCGLNIVPTVHAPLTLNDWLMSDLPETKLVLAPNNRTENPLHNAKHTLALLIGPEGGLSDTELEHTQEYGFVPWCIGERVLRTETAPITALSILNFVFK